MVAIDPRLRSTYADASWTPFWLDRDDRPPARGSLEGAHTVDLAIVGAGFTGLWAALQALEDMPGREVMVLEGLMQNDYQLTLKHLLDRCLLEIHEDAFDHDHCWTTLTRNHRQLFLERLGREIDRDPLQRVLRF